MTAVIQGLLGGGGTIDKAWLGASAYAKAYLTDPEAVDVVLVKTKVDGSVGYHFDRLCPQGQEHHLAGRHEGQGLRLRRSELDIGLPDPVS